MAEPRIDPALKAFADWPLLETRLRIAGMLRHLRRIGLAEVREAEPLWVTVNYVDTFGVPGSFDLRVEEAGRKRAVMIGPVDEDDWRELSEAALLRHILTATREVLKAALAQEGGS